jgi:hypothetical protein
MRAVMSLAMFSLLSTIVSSMPLMVRAGFICRFICAIDLSNSSSPLGQDCQGEF